MFFPLLGHTNKLTFFFLNWDSMIKWLLFFSLNEIVMIIHQPLTCLSVCSDVFLLASKPTPGCKRVHSSFILSPPPLGSNQIQHIWKITSKIVCGDTEWGDVSPFLKVSPSPRAHNTHNIAELGLHLDPLLLVEPLSIVLQRGWMRYTSFFLSFLVFFKKCSAKETRASTPVCVIRPFLKGQKNLPVYLCKQLS